MNLRQPELSSQRITLSEPRGNHEQPYSLVTASLTSPDGCIIQVDKAEASSSPCNRKRSSSTDLQPEARRARYSDEVEEYRLLRLETLAQNLQESQARLRIENFQLRGRLNASQAESSRLELILESQQQAILERNQAIQLLLQQPGLQLQQQEHGSALTSPGVPSPLAIAPTSSSNNGASSNLSMSNIQVAAQEQQQEQQNTMVLLQQEQQRSQGHQQGYTPRGSPIPLVTNLSTSTLLPPGMVHQTDEQQSQDQQAASSLSFQQSSDTLSPSNDAADLRTNAQALRQNQQAIQRIQAQLDEFKM